MITGRQIRAARALLDWSASDLAEKSGLTRETVSRAETDAVQIREDSLKRLVDAFDDAGIEFLPRDGVRRKDRMVQTYDGEDANKKLLDDIYKTVRDTGGEVLISGVDESLAVKDMGDEFLQQHLARLNASSVTERVLIQQGDINFAGAKHIYRWLPKDTFSPYPLYIYGNKIALGSWAPNSRCIIIDDAPFAESIRKLFNFIWDKAYRSPRRQAEEYDG